jgi:hypothetical protein
VLREKEAETLPELLHVIGPNCLQISGFYEIRDWLDPQLIKILNHSRPHHFKFVNSGNVFKNYYKGNCNDAWIELASLFTDSLPKGQPKLIEPNFEHLDGNRLAKCIESWRILFSDYHEKYRWWKEFSERIKVLNSTKSKRMEYGRIDSLWILPKLPKQRGNLCARNEPLQLPPALQTLLDEEAETPQVRFYVLFHVFFFTYSLCYNIHS